VVFVRAFIVYGVLSVAEKLMAPSGLAAAPAAAASSQRKPEAVRTVAVRTVPETIVVEKVVIGKKAAAVAEEEKREPVLSLPVQDVGRLNLYEGDDVNTAVDAFCATHGLGQQAKIQLVKAVTKRWQEHHGQQQQQQQQAQPIMVLPVVLAEGTVVFSVYNAANIEHETVAFCRANKIEMENCQKIYNAVAGRVTGAQASPAQAAPQQQQRAAVASGGSEPLNPRDNLEGWLASLLESD
jgi:hypothetical protein